MIRRARTDKETATCSATSTCLPSIAGCWRSYARCAAVRLWQTIYGWWVYLWSPQPGFGTLRRYLFVQALRVRARRFAGPLLEIVVLSAVLIGLLWLHRHLGYVG